MSELIYPTYFRGMKFPVVNPEFEEGTDINVNLSGLCPDLESCDENTNVCYNKYHVDCGFYMLRRGLN